MISFAESLAAKFPEDEREELIEFMANALRSLSPQDRAEVMDLHAAEVRAKIREYGGLITTEQAREKMYNEKIERVYEIAKDLAMRSSHATLLRDLEIYRETPEVAILKHMPLSDLLHRMRQLRDKGLST
jgi:hypothetical protein